MVFRSLIGCAPALTPAQAGVAVSTGWMPTVPDRRPSGAGLARAVLASVARPREPLPNRARVSAHRRMDQGLRYSARSVARLGGRLRRNPNQCTCRECPDRASLRTFIWLRSTSRFDPQKTSALPVGSTICHFKRSSPLLVTTNPGLYQSQRRKPPGPQSRCPEGAFNGRRSEKFE